MIDNNLKAKFVNIASQLELDVSSLDWSEIDNEVLSVMIDQLSLSLPTLPTNTKDTAEKQHDNIELAGFIDNTNGNQFSKIYGNTARLEVLRLYEKYKEDLPSDFIERYGFEYIVKIRYGIERGEINRLRTSSEDQLWFYEEYLQACLDKDEKLVREFEETKTWSDFHAQILTDRKTGYQYCSIWDVVTGKHTSIQWESIKRKLVIANERDSTLGLPSEHRFGFKSRVYFDQYSREIVGYEIVNGSNFIKQREIEDLIPFVSRFSKTLKELKTEKRRKQFIRRSKPNKVFKSQVGRKLEADYKVKKAKVKISTGTRLPSNPRLGEEAQNASHWKDFPLNPNRQKSKEYYQISVSKCGTQIWVHFSTSRPSIYIAKTALLPSSGMLTVVPVRPISRNDEILWFLYHEVLSYLGLRQDRVMDTVKKIDRKVLLSPPKPEHNYDANRKALKEGAEKQKKASQFIGKRVQRRSAAK